MNFLITAMPGSGKPDKISSDKEDNKENMVDSELRKQLESDVKSGCLVSDYCDVSVCLLHLFTLMLATSVLMVDFTSLSFIRRNNMYWCFVILFVTNLSLYEKFQFVYFIFILTCCHHCDHHHVAFTTDVDFPKTHRKSSSQSTSSCIFTYQCSLIVCFCWRKDVFKTNIRGNLLFGQ